MKTFMIICSVATLLILSASVSVAEGVWTRYEGIGKVVSLAADGNFLWCATDDGVSRFDKRTQEFTNYTTADGLIDNRVVSVAIDKDGIKWFGTWGGVSSFDDKKWRTFNVVDSSLIDENYSIGKAIFSVAVDLNNVKWFGSHYGAFSFDGTTWKHYGRAEGLRDVEIGRIMVDKSNKKWFGTWHDVVEYDGIRWEEHELFPSLSYGTGWAMAEDKDNALWFSTDGGSIELFYDASTDGGIFRFDGKEWKKFWTSYWIIDHGPRKIADVFVPGIDGIVHNYFNDIAVDRNNVKWFVADRGISSFDGVSWRIEAINEEWRTETWYYGKSGFYSVTVDCENIKWFGVENGIISYRDDAPTLIKTENNSQPPLFLLGNFPNPFNPSTAIKFEIKSSTPVSLVIYNASGQKVKTLVENSRLAAGAHSFIWDGKDYSGKAVSSGIYFYQIKMSDFVKTGKMMLVR